MDADPHTTHFFPLDMSSPISTLPVELQHEIAAQGSFTPSLQSLCLVSHAWNEISTPLLYGRQVDVCFDFDHGRRMNVDWSQPCQFARTLVARPDLAALVTGVHFQFETYDYGDSDYSGTHASFEDKQNEYDADVMHQLRTIVGAVTNIVKLSFRANDGMFSKAILEVETCANTLQHLATLDIRGDSCNIARLLSLSEALPSLTNLRVFNLDVDPSSQLTPESSTLALQSLNVAGHLSDRAVLFLAATPTCHTLRSVKYSYSLYRPHDSSTISWHQFINLRSVELVITVGIDGVEHGGTELGTCVAAETVKIRMTQYREHPSVSARHDVLHFLPSSVLFLDFSSGEDCPSVNFLAWLRDNKEQCPNLRTLRLAKSSLTWKWDYAKKQDRLEAEQERQRRYDECEEICERRGIACSWVPQ